jgi:hypothetical protein
LGSAGSIDVSGASMTACAVTDFLTEFREHLIRVLTVLPGEAHAG